MIAFLKNLWHSLVSAAENERRRREEEQTILRENIEAWNEINKDFIHEFDKEVDKEIDDRYDISKIKTGNGHNYYDFGPLP